MMDFIGLPKSLYMEIQVKPRRVFCSALFAKPSWGDAAKLCNFFTCLLCSSANRNPRKRKFDVEYIPPGGLPAGEKPIKSPDKLEKFVRKSILKARDDRVMANNMLDEADPGLPVEPQVAAENDASPVPLVSESHHTMDMRHNRSLGSECTMLLFDIQRTLRCVRKEHNQSPLPDVDHLVGSAIQDQGSMGGLKTVTVLMGPNGEGKTFLLNAWIQETIMDNTTYMRNHEGMALVGVLHGLEAFHDLHLQEAQSRGLDSIPRLEHGSISCEFGEWKCNTTFEIATCVPENAQENPGDLELQTLHVELTVRPEEVHQEDLISDSWRPFQDYYLRGILTEFKEGFILPSLERGKATTSFSTILCYGKTIHAIIRFMSEDEVMRDAQAWIDCLRMKFADGDWELSEEELNEEPANDDKYLYDVFKTLVKEEHQRITRSTFDQRPLKEILKDHEVRPEHIREPIRKLLGRCRVISGRGDNLTADSCFIRKHLLKIHDPKQEGGTMEHMEHVLVSSIRVYVPASVVEGGGEIHDTPGCDDCRQRQGNELLNSLTAAHQVVTVQGRDLESRNTVREWLLESGFLRRLVRAPDNYQLSCVHTQKGQISLGESQHFPSLEAVCRLKPELDRYFNDSNTGTTNLLRRQVQSIAAEIKRSEPDVIREDVSSRVDMAMRSVQAMSPLVPLSISLQLSRIKATNHLMDLKKVHKQAFPNKPFAFANLEEVLEYCKSFDLLLNVMGFVHKRSLSGIKPIVEALGNGLQPRLHNIVPYALPNVLVEAAEKITVDRLVKLLKTTKNLGALGYNFRTMTQLQLDLEQSIKNAIESYKKSDEVQNNLRVWTSANKEDWAPFQKKFPLKELTHFNASSILRVKKFPIRTFICNADRRTILGSAKERCTLRPRELPQLLGCEKLLHRLLCEAVRIFMSLREKDFQNLLVMILKSLARDQPLDDTQVKQQIIKILDEHPCIFQTIKDAATRCLEDIIKQSLSKDIDNAIVSGLRRYVQIVRDNHGDDLKEISNTIKKSAQEEGFRHVYAAMLDDLQEIIPNRCKRAIKASDQAGMQLCAYALLNLSCASFGFFLRCRMRLRLSSTLEQNVRHWKH